MFKTVFFVLLISLSVIGTALAGKAGKNTGWAILRGDSVGIIIDFREAENSFLESKITYGKDTIDVLKSNNFGIYSSKDLIFKKEDDRLTVFMPINEKIDPLTVQVGDVIVTYEETGITFSRYGNSIKVSNHAYYNFSNSTIIVRQNGVIKELTL